MNKDFQQYFEAVPDARAALVHSTVATLRSIFYCSIFFLSVLSSSCGRATDEPSQADKAMEELKNLYESARRKAPEDPVEWAKEDLQRFGDWEYRVLSLEVDSPGALEAKLNKHGSERWEVFWIREEGNQIVVFLKRPAKSYLRSVPFSEIGKAVSGQESSE